jgi:uncharacterized paraquat-inducible protein A
MSIFLLALLTVAALAPLGLLHRLQHLPYAPDCPRCRTVTHAVQRSAALDRAWALLVHTTVRRCGACGWRGRMRWRWATHRVRPDGKGG